MAKTRRVKFAGQSMKSKELGRGSTAGRGGGW
jgi:hypothetical protein